MKRFLVLILGFVVTLAANFPIGIIEKTANASSDEAKSTVTYMLCGYDDAACNTDSIVLASYSFSDNSLSFLQIPRDTYYRDTNYSKINSIFPTQKSLGSTDTEALVYLKTALSDALGITIDAAIGYTMQTFVKLIDAIGGVDVELPSSFAVNNGQGECILSLNAGSNHLDGEDSLAFVRARAGYTTGDLGRVDAQKIFISSFMKMIRNDVGVTDIVKACISTSDGWTLDAKLGTLFKIIAKNRGRISNISAKYASVPGMQVQSAAGDWYYSVAKAPTVELLQQLGFSRIKEFDEHSMLLNSSDESFVSIYNSQQVRARVYDDESLPLLDDRSH